VKYDDAVSALGKTSRSILWPTTATDMEYFICIGYAG
jgi:hypothetical protein